MAPRGASLLVAARRRPSLASRILAIGGAVVPAPAVPSGPGPAVLAGAARRFDNFPAVRVAAAAAGGGGWRSPPRGRPRRARWGIGASVVAAARWGSCVHGFAPR